MRTRMSGGVGGVTGAIPSPRPDFLRIRREPVFRILSIDSKSGEIAVTIEHGEAAKGRGTRRTFLLKRDDSWKLRAEAF